MTSSSSTWGGTRYSPMAFTEQGVAMLSSVFNSERAIEVNILIIRAFVKLREMITSNKDLSRRLDELEKKYDGQFRVVFEAIQQLMAPPKPKRKIGFEQGQRANPPQLASWVSERTTNNKHLPYREDSLDLGAGSFN